MGAGTGRLAVPLAGRRLDVVALDASAQMLREARRKGGKVRLVRGDVASLPFREKSFDAALLSFVLQTLPEPRQALREASRVAHGVVIVTALVDTLENDILAEAFPSLVALDKRRFARPEELEARLREMGLDVEREVVALSRNWSVPDYLEAVRGRYISSLSLLPPGELESGVEFLERELPRRHTSGELTRTSRVAFIGGRTKTHPSGTGNRGSSPTP